MRCWYIFGIWEVPVVYWHPISLCRDLVILVARIILSIHSLTCQSPPLASSESPEKISTFYRAQKGLVVALNLKIYSALKILISKD